MSPSKSTHKKRVAPARPVTVVRTAPEEKQVVDERGKRTAPELFRYLPAVAALWSLVILLWVAQVLRAPTSIVFLLALGVVVVGVVAACQSVARPRDLWGTARRGVLLVLLVLVPVAFDPRTVDAFNVAKFSVVSVGAFALVSLWVLQSAHDRAFPRFHNGLQWLVLASLAWTVLTTVTSLNPRLSLVGAYQSYDGLCSAVAFAVVFFAVAEAFAITDVKTALSVLYFGGGGLTALYGFFQLHDRVWGGRWDWVNWGTSLSFSTGTSIWSTFGNPNHLAGFLAIILPVGLVLLMLHRRWWARAVILVIAALLVLQLLQTTTRGAWLATLAALATLAVLMFPEMRRRPRLSLSVAGGLAVLVVAGTLVLGSAGDMARQFGSIIEFDAGSTASQRTTFWKTAIRIANDHPVVGTGPDSYESVNPAYQRVRTNGAHNVFMSYLATQGYPALLLFLAVLAFAALRTVGAIKRLRSIESADGTGVGERAREARLALSAVAAGIVAYLVQGSFDLQQVGLSFVFWALLGLACVVARDAGVPDTLRFRALVGGAADSSLGAGRPSPLRDRKRDRRDRSTTLSRRPPRKHAVITGVMVATAAVCVAIFAGTVTRPHRADHNYWSALNDNAEARALRPTNATKAEKLIDRSQELMERAISLNPWQPKYLAVVGSAKFTLAQSLPPRSPQQLSTLDEAWEYYRRAVALAPLDSQLLRSYARVLLGIDRMDARQTVSGEARAEAVDVLRRAVQASPFDRRLREQLKRIEAEQRRRPRL